MTKRNLSVKNILRLNKSILQSMISTIKKRMRERILNKVKKVNLRRENNNSMLRKQRRKSKLTMKLISSKTVLMIYGTSSETKTDNIKNNKDSLVILPG